MVYVTAREGEQEKMGHHDEAWSSSPWILLASTPVSCTRPLYERHDTIEWTQQPEKEEKERTTIKRRVTIKARGITEILCNTHFQKLKSQKDILQIHTGVCSVMIMTTS